MEFVFHGGGTMIISENRKPELKSFHELMRNTKNIR